MALNHYWCDPRQLRIPMLDAQLAEGLRAMARTQAEWQTLRRETQVAQQKARRMADYGRRYQALRRTQP